MRSRIIKVPGGRGGRKRSAANQNKPILYSPSITPFPAKTKYFYKFMLSWLSEMWATRIFPQVFFTGKNNITEQGGIYSNKPRRGSRHSHTEEKKERQAGSIITCTLTWMQCNNTHHQRVRGKKTARRKTAKEENKMVRGTIRLCWDVGSYRKGVRKVCGK